LGNLRRVANKEAGTHTGRYFNDSDVYKWIEAAAYGLALHPNDQVRGQLETAISVVIAAQEPDGYINSFFQLNHPDLKFKNLNSLHEMYCGGHLIEAGVAVFECLGDRRLLEASIKFADLLMSQFGPEKRRGYPGHEEIELALIKLARVIGQDRYREFARYMMEERGKRPTVFESELQDPVSLSLSPFAPRMLTRNGDYSGEYCQDHAPIRDHTHVVGHAVRAMYFYTAAADLADGQVDAALEQALTRTWQNLTQRRMYITGGVGPSSENEGFTADFDLPNLTAYAETCAACGLILWGQQMLEQTGNSEYADVIEAALYNGMVSGISLDGTRYFYDNPLESRGNHSRTEWFDCACCPPNVARLIGSLGKYVASEAPDRFYIHQFAGIDASSTLNGVVTHIELECNFPWDGKILIRVEPESAVRFTLFVRLPEWSDNVEAEIPGSEDEAQYEDGYALFDRTWQNGDVVTIDLGIQPVWIEANPRVRDNLGRSALKRGPVVYCAESVDLGFAPQLLTIDAEIEVQEQVGPDGVVALIVSGFREIEQDDPLYVPRGTVDADDCNAKFIPYHTWANRGPSEMQVWVRG
jgi:DUF1680 family protein